MTENKINSFVLMTFELCFWWCLLPFCFDTFTAHCEISCEYICFVAVAAFYFHLFALEIKNSSI